MTIKINVLAVLINCWTERWLVYSVVRFLNLNQLSLVLFIQLAQTNKMEAIDREELIIQHSASEDKLADSTVVKTVRNLRKKQ